MILIVKSNWGGGHGEEEWTSGAGVVGGAESDAD
jgi:hypothetical protein